MTTLKFERRKRIIGNNAEHEGIFALQDIKKGDIVYEWKGATTSAKKDRFTTQIGENKHVLFKDNDFQYYNHSCSPNFHHDFSKNGSYAIKDIPKGTELTHFYCSNEWEMAEQFFCKCGSKNCIGFIGGAKYLPVGRINELSPLLAPHTKSLLLADLNKLISKL
eukprot:201653_1